MHQRQLFIRYGYLLFLACGIGLWASCKTTADAGEPGSNLTDEPAPPSDLSEEGLLGTIQYLEFEGGFYGIVADNGNNYLPINLGDDYKQDSLRVRFTMRARNDVMTIAMWGQPVEIVQIERLSSP